MMSSRSRRSCTMSHSSFLRRRGLEGRLDKGTLQEPGWAKDEDEKLLRLLKEFGSNSWSSVSLHFTGQRSAVECQRRWQQIKNPELVKGPWTQEEDERVTHRTLTNSTATVYNIILYFILYCLLLFMKNTCVPFYNQNKSELFFLH
ncbi:transcriptional activator Myb-like [Labrus mixtus]|uniref:transcriptional activator Myb-like n=1 Tax=Labrus mixtus TaxID=508554 RepID=UPI0029C09DA8|nr:transcriptional activator Myb-like [Labrus mixtus]